MGFDLAPLSVALQEPGTCCAAHSAGFSNGGQCPQLFSSTRQLGNVIEDRDADLEWHHPVVTPVDQEHGGLDAGGDTLFCLYLVRLVLFNVERIWARTLHAAGHHGHARARPVRRRDASSSRSAARDRGCDAAARHRSQPTTASSTRPAPPNTGSRQPSSAMNMNARAPASSAKPAMTLDSASTAADTRAIATAV